MNYNDSYRDRDNIESMDIETTPIINSIGGYQAPTQLYVKEELKLWVGNLPDNVTDADIKELFSKYKVENTKLTISNTDKKPCAFITFFDKETAVIAKEDLLKQTYKGYKLKVNWASIKPPKYAAQIQQTTLIESSSSPPPPPTHQHHDGHPHHLQSHHHDPYNNGYSAQYQSGYYGDHHNSVHNNSNIMSPSINEKITDCDPHVNKKLFIGGLDDYDEVSEMRNIFSKYGEVEDVMITNKGVAFIRFVKTEAAILAKRALSRRYKIQYDKREKCDDYHYDKNGPSSVEYNGSHRVGSQYYHHNNHPISSPPPHIQSTPPQHQQFSEPLSPEEANQYLSFLQNLIPTNAAICESKDWFILHLKSGRSIIQLIQRYINNQAFPNIIVKNKVEVVYLINDLLYFGFVRRVNPLIEMSDPISILFDGYLPSILSSFVNESPLIQQAVAQILDIWAEKKYYSFATTEKLKTFIYN